MSKTNTSIGLGAVDVTDKKRTGAALQDSFSAGITRSEDAAKLAEAKAQYVQKLEPAPSLQSKPSSSRRPASCPPPEHAH